MPVTEDLWRCSECPRFYNWGGLHSCATCGHTRCGRCSVENDRQQTLNISLQKAVKEDNMDVVLQLLNSGADVNLRQERMSGMRDSYLSGDIYYSETPLERAIRNKLLDIAKVLIENGADIHAKDSDLNTPLHIAVCYDLHITKLLIEKGSDINAKNSTLNTPLHIAVSHDLDIAKFLIKKGADIGAKNSALDTPLHAALKWIGIESVNQTTVTSSISSVKMLESDSSNSEEDDDEPMNDDDDEPMNEDDDEMMISTIPQLLDIAKELIEAGADVNEKNKSHDTALHVAVRHGLLDLTKISIEAGADVNAKNGSDDTALHVAVRRGLLDLTKILIEAGADVNAKNNGSETPLHIAVERGILNIIALLLDKGANANTFSNLSRTALTMALQKLPYGVVEDLLQAGALARETIQEQVVSIQSVSQGITVDIMMDWDVSHIMESKFYETEDFRNAVTLTGSVQNAQMMSCEDYVDQTWGDSGLKILDMLIRALRSRNVVTDNFDGRVIRFLLHKRTMRIVAEAHKGKIVGLMEQIAWLGCVFAREKTKSEHGPFLATGSYVFSPTSGTYQLRIQSHTFKGFQNEPCWTKILRRAMLAVGFPVRERPEGVGLEIPFPLLLRFADISVCMEYDGGTLLVGESNILFPSRKLKDGIQWHIADATSAQEAAQVINESPDWIRTDNIGQLVEHRAYLGYCRSAMVLLGTRELLFSQTASDLFCGLDKSKSRIELVREGSMSAGFSYHGINTTVGGKWSIPPQLNVSLEDNRDLEDLLMNAHRRPVLVYDRNEDRGWLVPELSLVLHMALTYLQQADVRQRCPPSVQETLLCLTGVVDDGLEVYNLVKASWNFELYKKVEDGQMKTFGMVIRDFMKDLQKLRTAENMRRIEKSFKLSLFSSRTLRGWDFSELASKAENLFQREMKWKEGSPMWAMLGDTHDMLVILGSCLGDLVRPDLEKTIVNSGWETTPKGVGLLTATNSCVLQLAQKEILLTVNQMTPKQRSEKLFWYRPTVHPGCNCYNACVSIHEITQKGTKTCTKTREPQKLETNGATVFGCANAYHKSLKRGAH